MKTFMVRSYDEGGVRSSDDAKRLVCLTETNERVVIWGSEGNSANIEAVLAVRLPCEIECETCEPADWSRRAHGHDYWVPEDASLKVILARIRGHID